MKKILNVFFRETWCVNPFLSPSTFSIATKFSDPVLCTRLKKRRRRFTGREGEEEDFWNLKILNLVHCLLFQK